MAYFTQPLSASVSLTDSLFGFSVALNGSRAAIGAPKADAFRGRVYIFDRDVNGYYTQSANIQLPVSYGTQAGAGYSVALNGNHLYIGAPKATCSDGEDRGAVFEYVYSGSTWTLTQTISSLEHNSLRYAGAFGYSFALSGGDYNMFVGAPSAQNTCGAVFQYRRTNNTSPWTFVDVFSADLVTTPKYSYLGSSVAVTDDGIAGHEEFFAGAPGTPTYDPTYGSLTPSTPGNVLCWRYYNSPANEYLPSVLSLGGNWRATNGDRYGHRLEAYNGTLLIGAPHKYVGTLLGGATYSGAAFVASRVGLGYTLQSIISSDILDTDDSLGCALALSGTPATGATVALVGAKYATSFAAGKVYAYNITIPATPQLYFTIDSFLPDNIARQFGTALSILPATGNGVLLTGAQGDVLSTPGAGDGDRIGQAFISNDIGLIQPTPTPTVTPPLASPTPTPTPQPTPRFLAPNWYGLASLDPISFKTGAGNTSANYPKVPSKGGPGRTFSIIQELGSQAPISVTNYYLTALAVIYRNYCVAPNLNTSTDTAMSEFGGARGYSLAFGVNFSSTAVTPTKYHTTIDGTATVSVTNNPMRASTYNLTIAGQTCTSATTCTRSSIDNGTYNWSVEDTVTGYVRTGTVDVTYGGGARSGSVDYKVLCAFNPPT